MTGEALERYKRDYKKTWDVRFTNVYRDGQVETWDDPLAYVRFIPDDKEKEITYIDLSGIKEIVSDFGTGVSKFIYEDGRVDVIEEKNGYLDYE